MNAPSTLRVVLREWTGRLAAAGSESARLDTEVLLCDALGVNRAWLVAHADDVLDTRTLQHAQAHLRRRQAGEPVAYITGRREFWSLSFEVERSTLVPRPETELLVEAALAEVSPGCSCRVADLGTGSGIIAVVIAHERPLASVVATDASAAALTVAARNVERHVAGRVSLLQGDWWAPLGGRRFEVVVSNPPYVAAGDPHLLRGDLRHEPVSALVGGEDGLRDIERIIAGAPAHLEAGGVLLIEHGAEQASSVGERLRAAGFEAVRSLADLAGLARVSVARWP